MEAKLKKPPKYYTGNIGELSDVHLGRALSCMVLGKLDVKEIFI